MKIPYNVKHMCSRGCCRAESPSSPHSFLNRRSLSSLLRSLQHMPTHAAAQAHVIWNCIFPSLSHSYLSFTQGPPLIYRSLSCIHVRAPRGPDSHLNRTGSSAPLSAPSPPLSPCFFSLQFKWRKPFIVLTEIKTCAACKEHYVIIWEWLMMLLLTDGWKAKHIDWSWNVSMLLLITLWHSQKLNSHIY